MKAARVLAAVCLGIGALFILGGCFFVRPPQITGPVLLVGHLLCGVGEETEIPVEVLDFPAPGVAGLAILDLRYDPRGPRDPRHSRPKRLSSPLFLRG
jgi:hypothetical protein